MLYRIIILLCCAITTVNPQLEKKFLLKTTQNFCRNLITIQANPESNVTLEIPTNISNLKEIIYTIKILEQISQESKNISKVTLKKIRSGLANYYVNIRQLVDIHVRDEYARFNDLSDGYRIFTELINQLFYAEVSREDHSYYPFQGFVIEILLEMSRISLSKTVSSEKIATITEQCCNRLEMMLSNHTIETFNEPDTILVQFKTCLDQWCTRYLPQTTSSYIPSAKSLILVSGGLVMGGLGTVWAYTKS